MVRRYMALDSFSSYAVHLPLIKKYICMAASWGVVGVAVGVGGVKGASVGSPPVVSIAWPCVLC